MSGSYPDFSKDFAIKEVEVKEPRWCFSSTFNFIPKNIKYDGNTPCYLTGYGAYGVSQQPGFIDVMATILEQGCCIALHTLGAVAKKEKNGIGQE